MRRRNKPRVVWLPNTEASGFGTTSTIYGAGTVTLTGGESGDSGTLEFPIVQDGIQSDPLQPTSTLADITQSGYRLRRIVGKIYCFHSQGENEPAFTFVTAGLMIRRFNPDTGGSLAVAAGAGQPFDLVAPGFTTNQMDPWIWRRTWMLGSQQTSIDGAGHEILANTDSGEPRNFGRAYPGGIAEGPHVDQKTARIVGPEERLYLDVSATVFAQRVTPTAPTIGVAFELRCLASMKASVGNRNNASR